MNTTPVALWSDAAAFPLLSTLTLVPLLTTVAILCSRSSAGAIRWAFAGVFLSLLLSVYLLAVFEHVKPGMQLVESMHFIGLSYRVGVDGSNILLLPLTTLITFLVLIYAVFTRYVTDKGYLACLSAYETILIGAFAAMNIMQFWLWCLLELIPVVILTVRAGTGQNRRWAVTLLLQYWGSGMLMTLAGFQFLAFGLVGSDHDLSFDWLTLKENNAYLHDEVLIFILLFFGYAIRMPLFPFHGWLPLLAEHGTVAGAPIFLVGLKLGVYAIIRFILPILPGVAEEWQGFVLTLGLISIFYGALLAMMQINIRRLLAFAAISHTGVLIIGIFCFNEYGLQGSILLSIAYSLATVGMLFSIGLIYQRTRSAFIPRLGGLFDSHSANALLFLLSALSTMIMPGTPGFDAAHLLMTGVINEKGWLMTIAILLGNFLTASVLLRAFQQIYIASPKRMQAPCKPTNPAHTQERVLAIAICLLLAAGFYTTPWLDFIDEETAALVKSYPRHSAQQPDTAIEPVLDEQ